MVPCTCEIGFRIERVLEFRRTEPSRTVVLWRFVKDGNELTASAVWIERDDACLEFKLNGEIQPSPIYHNVVEFAAAADEERRRLLEQGWREVPPIVSGTRTRGRGEQSVTDETLGR